MIQHIFKHIPSIFVFNTKKVSSGPTNEGYYIGESSEQIGKPDILWTDICFIESEKLIWTHGVFYAQEQEIPTKLSDLTNDCSFITLLDVSTFVQPLDISVQNIYKELENTEEVLVNAMLTLNSSFENTALDLTLLQTSISTINTSINNINDDISTLQDSITTIDNSINDISDDISTLQDDITTINSSINDIVTDVSALDVSMTNIYNELEQSEFVIVSYLNELNTSVNNNILDISLLKNSVNNIDDIVTDVSALDVSVQNLYTELIKDEKIIANSLTSLNASINDNTQVIGTIQNDISILDILTEDVSALDSSIQNLYKELEDDEEIITNSLTSLNDLVNINTQDIEAIQNDVSTLDDLITDVQTLKTNVSILTENVSILTDDVSSLDVSLQNLYIELEKDEELIANNLILLNTSIDNNTQAIETMQTNISGSLDDLIANVSILKTDVSTLTSNVNTLISDVSIMDNSINNMIVDISLLDASMLYLYNDIDETERVIAFSLTKLNTSINNNIEDISILKNNIETKADKINVSIPTYSDTIAISPNIYYKLGTISSSVNIILNNPIDETILNEYMMTFDVSGTPTITLPNTLIWLNNDVPTFEHNTTYQISIIDNKAIYGKF